MRLYCLTRVNNRIKYLSVEQVIAPKHSDNARRPVTHGIEIDLKTGDWNRYCAIRDRKLREYNNKIKPAWDKEKEDVHFDD